MAMQNTTKWSTIKHWARTVKIYKKKNNKKSKELYSDKDMFR